MKTLLIFNFEQTDDMTHPETYGVAVNDDSFDFASYHDSVMSYIDIMDQWSPKRLIQDTMDWFEWNWVIDGVPACDKMEAIWI